MLPVSSNGELRVTFTKPVSWPESILATIDVEKLVGLTFEPKTYDYETDEDGKTTELTSWEIVRIQPTYMDLTLQFANPNLIGYSLFENDQVLLDIDFRSVFDDGSGDELYGSFVKSVPLQYPESLDAESIIEINQMMEVVPGLVLAFVVFCMVMLMVSSSVDHAQIVWLVLSHLNLVAFLPLMNVPVPAQVNEISKGLAKYLRLDVLETGGRSLMTTMADYIFDFPPSSEVMPLHYEQMGFESRNAFSTAFGLNFLHCVIALPVIALLIGASVFRLRFRFCGTIFYRLRGKFYNTFYIRYNLETYFVYLIANMLAVQRISFYNWAASLQSLTSGIHLVLLAVLPLAVVVFYSMNYDKLVLHKNFRATWGTLYAGMITDSEETKRKVVIYYQAAQLSRKFVFAFCLVVMR